MNKVQNYIQNKQSKKPEYLLFNKIPILVEDQITNDFAILDFINSLESVVPANITKIVKSIIILDSPVFEKKQVNALYHNGIIYISNKQDDIADAVDDVVHEYAHSLEENYSGEIYLDDSIKDEFLVKREQLERVLRHQGFNTSKYDFNNIKYNNLLDNFLLNIVKYEVIEKLTDFSLFINPYAITSLREYFATGIEEYILGDDVELQRISSKLYQKIKELIR
tara:strand:+ start:395 stop:1063 length:669 start_codon:yes stop_codon:yes gene_type:complete